VARLGRLPATLRSTSRTDGLSGIYLFSVPAGTTLEANPADGVQVVQWFHRYVTCWPSTHPEGRPYEWFDGRDQDSRVDEMVRLPGPTELPALPAQWLQELASVKVAGSRAATREEAAAFVTAHVAGRADSNYLEAAVRPLLAASKGARHDTLVTCACWAAREAAAGWYPADAAFKALEVAWARVTPDEHREHECIGAILYAIAQAEGQPDRVARMAATAGTEPAPAAAPVSTLPAPLDWAAFAARDANAPQWLVDLFWPAGRAMALWADAKEGKSELALWCAHRLALGVHPWTNAPAEPVDVAYFDWEMTEDDLDDRLSEFDVDPRRLGRLHYFLLPALHPLDSETGGEEVLQLLEACGARVAVFDTFTRAVTGEENDADTVRAFYRHTGIRLKQASIAYLRTDHAGKTPARGQRGSSAKRDDVDVVWWMKRTPTPPGILLSCDHGSRLSWVGPKLQLERVVDATGIVRYTTPLGIGVPAGTLDKMRELDQVGFPLDGGRPSAKAALRAAGLRPGRNEVLSAALNERRKRAVQAVPIVPGTAPTPTCSGGDGDSAGTDPDEPF
jgi:hypothetical protein